MCGIVGVWEPGGGDLSSQESFVRSAMAKLHHRGPDSQGIYSPPAGGPTLGHQRLAIIDASPLGHQPMCSGDGRYVIAFNGEIYNFRELRAELESRGTRFRSRSDTEVLLEGYGVWGEDVLERLVGQFAFGIWDNDRRRLFLARDRLGEKPLYYARTARAFAFASEIQALRGLEGVDLSIEPAAVQLYLEQLYVPAPLSIHVGIRKLMPGHAMFVDEASTNIWRYWDPLPVATRPARRFEEGQALEELDHLLRRSVKQQMISD